MKLCKHVSLAGDDNGANLLDGKRGTYFQLNATGSIILHRLLSGETIGEIASYLSSEFSVDSVSCAQDIESLANLLKKKGLVE
ncbi:PqqD family peptide modification chaperone [Glutamicibacter sp. NPDC087344]|uniref:PqqD family peptide modification chaperone n=1 Tax=Glutamicibacter sp. NPDC087344 TaxID=3363994 RepID=UPI00380EE5E8